jgi:hypothetical protein
MAAALPVVDLSADVERQVVVEAGAPEIYQGHPTTALLPDGKFVATTYIKFRPGPEKHSIIGTRFRLDDLEKR